MKIKDIIDENRGVITIGFHEKVGKALQLLLDNKISCLPVLDDNGKVIGVLSERDILRVVGKDPSALENSYVGDAMTKDILIGLIDDDLDYIMNIMSRNNIRHMPIMAKANLSGIISIRDVVRGLMKKVQAENRYMKDYISGKYEGYQ